MYFDLLVVTIAAVIASIITPIVILRTKKMESKDLTDEYYREYDWPARGEPYRIEYPQQLYVGITTHRIVDAANVVHCVPAPGYHGCVLRWVPKSGCSPVKF